MNLTIDTHHHLLPYFFFEETNDVHASMGGLAPMAWTKEASLSSWMMLESTSLYCPSVHRECM
jgi:hypothetical protein